MRRNEAVMGRQRAWSGVNHRVWAIASRMHVAQLWTLLRGDPARQPAPPRHPSLESSFVLHLRPRTYPEAATWFTHTFRLGFFTVFLLGVEIFSGLLLMVYYTPTPESAYASILRLMGRVPFGALLRDIHRLAGEAMVVCAVLHMVRIYLTASYKGARRFTWLTGMALLVATLAGAFSGYLLPWDQRAYWAVTIGTSMAEAVPLVGRYLNLMLRGGADIGADGLLRFYLLHVFALPLVGLLLLGAHYYRVSRLHGISLPVHLAPEAGVASRKLRARQPVRFIPDILTQEVVLSCLGIGVLLALAHFWYDAPLAQHADPKQTPLDTQAPWFFLWVQGLLKLGDKFLIGVLVPLAALVGLAAVPYIDSTPRRVLRRRPVALWLAGAALGAFALLGFLGTHHYGLGLPPVSRILQDMAPEGGNGPLSAVPHTQLAVGIYPTAETGADQLPQALAEVFGRFRDLIGAADAQGALPEARGVMIVEDWQADLKRVTLRILWSDPSGGRAKSDEHIVHLHRHRRPARD